MKVPVLRQREYLIASVQSALSDADLVELREDLMGMAVQYRARGVVIDVTPLDVLDSFAARTLRTIAQAIRLRGLEMVVVGIQPQVAFTMVQMGLRLEGVHTALDLEDGLSYLERQRSERSGHVE